MRRAAIAGLALVVLLSAAQPTHAAPVPSPGATSVKQLRRLDISRIGKVVNGPRWLEQDKTVGALVQLQGDPVAVRRTTQGSGFQRNQAVRQVRAIQDAAVPKLAAVGATTYGRLSTVLNALQVRVKVSDLDKVAHVPGVQAVQVSQTVRVNNAAAEQFTGVDRTWQDLGLTGKGQVIGLIDTGVDYTHADFGGPGTPAAYKDNNPAIIEPGTFPTAKVTGGYDFVGNAYDSSSTDPAKTVPQPDPDPLDCAAHGTHVAGTAVGGGVTSKGASYKGPYNKATLDKTFDVEPGVAPQATLKAYKVFGCAGTTDDGILAAALDRAVSDGVNVINMSLGAPYGTAHSLGSVAVETATAAGVLVVAAAGNEGSGAYIGSDPGTFDQSLSVAAVDADQPILPGVSISGAVTSVGLLANGTGLGTPVTGNLVDVGLGCAATDYAGARGKVVLSSRGTCARTARATFGQQAGARAVLMINNASGLPPWDGPIEGVTIPFVGVDGDQAARFKAAVGKSVTLSAGPDIPSPTFARVADFSSNGPRRLDSVQKPDVAAPGVRIPSAAMGTGTQAVRFSGTSMATPHTAGIAALVRQSHPTWSPMQVKSAIMSTASPSKIAGYDSARIGTGLVQPRIAAAAKAYAWTGSHLNSLRFGENQLSGSYTETQSFLITNKSSGAVTYDLRTKLSSPGYGADITILPRKVTVPAGATKTVAVRVHLGSSAVARLPGASANDGGKLTSLHGLVVARPRVLHKGISTLRIALLFVPVPLSDIRTSSSLTIPATGALPPITLRNAGVHVGTADLYAWLLSDPAGDATDPETPDLTNLGVQSLPGPVGGLAPSDRLLVFATSQASGTSTQASNEIDLLLDTDRDGTVDYVTLGADMGSATVGIPNGTMGAFTVNAKTGALVDSWPAPAPANGSTVLLPVAASRIGLGATSKPIDVEASGGAVLGQPAADLTGVARFNAYSPVVSQGDGAILKPGARASLNVTVNAKQLTQQSHLGWLVVTVDGKAGLHEADRVRLVTPGLVADPAAFTSRLSAHLTRPGTAFSGLATAASR